MVPTVLGRFIKDEVLRKADDAVARAEKSDLDDEGQFAEIIYETAQLYHHVLTRDELVNFYLHVLKTAVHEMVVQQCSKSPHASQRNLSAVR